MNLELKTVWSGDVHGPDRGLLCALDSRHPLRSASSVVISGAMIGRTAPAPVPCSTFQNLSMALRRQPLTIQELQGRFHVSRWVVDRTFYQLRLAGTLRSKDVPRTFSGPRKVYWIQETGR